MKNAAANHFTNPPTHGYHETYQDPDSFRTVKRVWFQPNAELPGRWLTLDQWAKVYDDPLTDPADLLHGGD